MGCSLMNKIKCRRNLKGYSMEYISKQLNVDVNEYSKVESGEIVPSKDFLIELGELLDEDLINIGNLKNVKIFDILNEFYNLQQLFKSVRSECIDTDKYNEFLEDCIYRKGLVYPKFLGEFKMSLNNIELLLFRESINVLKLKLELLKATP